MNAVSQHSSSNLMFIMAIAFSGFLVSVGCDSMGAAKTPPASVLSDGGEATQESAANKEEVSNSPATQSDSAAADVGSSSAVPAKAEPTQTRKRPTQLVSFDDLKLGMPVDAKFRPLMLQFNDGKVKEHLGQRIIVAGYMDSTDVMKGVKEFILLRNLECKFGPGGQADHLVRIYLAEDESTSFTDKIVYVEGELTLNPFPADPQEPITWSIYDMIDAKVSTRRPR